MVVSQDVNVLSLLLAVVGPDKLLSDVPRELYKPSRNMLMFQRQTSAAGSGAATAHSRVTARAKL